MNDTIIAVFQGRVSVVYTMNIFELLKTDKDVTLIYNAVTGEILYKKQEV